MDKRKEHQIKTVLFDLDGTIIDSGPGVKRCLRHTLKQYGKPDPEERDLNCCVGPPLTDTLGNRFGIPQDQVMEAIEVYRKEYNAGGIFECELYPGIADCIRTLHEKGYLLALTSSKVDVACRRIIDHFSLAPYFYEIVGSTPDASRERKADIIQAFFDAHPDLKKEESVLIGDTKFDAEGAKEAQVPFAAVLFGYGKKEDLYQTDAIAYFETADEIVSWVTQASR